MFDYAFYQPLFAEYGMTSEAVGRLIWGWQEPHRFYHTEVHLAFLTSEIEKLFQGKKINAGERKTLLMVAFFHDVIYDPTAFDNEEQSANLFLALTQSRQDTQEIHKIILETKNHQSTSPLSELFIGLDLQVLTHSTATQLLDYEKKIRKEFQYADYAVYKKVRINFLENFIKAHPANKGNIIILIDYIQQYRPLTGVYPGSFNPFHNGHLNILEKAENIFDKVIVARGVNPEKSAAENTSNYSQLKVLKYRQHEDFTGLLTDYISQKEEHSDITLIRGLRNGDDLDYEVNQLRFMEDMKPDIKVVFIRCDKQFEHISSSAIRNLEKISSGLGKKYLPE
jgi:pantetheine-phosphate adenylyltransferase